MTPTDAITYLRAAIAGNEGQSADVDEALSVVEHYAPTQAETLWKVMAAPHTIGSRHNATRVLDLIDAAALRVGVQEAIARRREGRESAVGVNHL